MAKFLPEPPYTHGTAATCGILVSNLGTPSAPTPEAVRKYLAEFLSDPRVVELPPALWKPILHGIVLRTRPASSAAKYAKIWLSEGSPLLVYTRRQAALLKGYLGERGVTGVAVEVGMRYGEPSIAQALERLKAQGCDRILFLPLYPQYAASTTATAQDALFRAMASYRSAPALRTIRHYHDHPGYIAALAATVRAHWRAHGRAGKLVMSFHGLPKVSLTRGDPYHCECQKTGRLLAEALGLSGDDYTVAFQSLFGRQEWLKPYTASVLEEFARAGVERVDVICPGFTADCLETLEEIGIEGKATFLSAGGKEYHQIPCLNDRDEWIRALADIALENLSGWVGPPADPAVLTRQRDLALALGAKQ